TVTRSTARRAATGSISPSSGIAGRAPQDSRRPGWAGRNAARQLLSDGRSPVASRDRLVIGFSLSALPRAAADEEQLARHRAGPAKPMSCTEHHHQARMAEGVREGQLLTRRERASRYRPGGVLPWAGGTHCGTPLRKARV